MSTKRKRPSGNWEYVVRRKGILPKPLTFTFETEAEGDAYVGRLEQMLDAGIVPDELIAQRDAFVSMRRQSGPTSHPTRSSRPKSRCSAV